MDKKQISETTVVRLPLTIKRGQNYWWMAVLFVAAIFLPFYMPFVLGDSLLAALSSAKTFLIVLAAIVIFILAMAYGIAAPAEIVISRTEIRITPQGKQTILRKMSEFDRVESVSRFSGRSSQSLIFIRVKKKPVSPWWRFRSDHDDKAGDISIPVSLGLSCGGYREMAQQLAQALGLKYQHVELVMGKPV